MQMNVTNTNYLSSLKRNNINIKLHTKQKKKEQQNPNKSIEWYLGVELRL